jgi:chondroitin AC lyase
MIMLKMNGDDIAEITVADPNRELRTVHFSVSSRIEKSGENFEAEWNEEEGVSEVAVELPQGVYAGESVTIEL